MNTRRIARLYDRYAIPVYNRLGIAVKRGRGSILWDEEGKRYLDFFPGWGVNALGHCPEVIAKVVSGQVRRLVHVPNTFYHEPQARLSEALIKSSFPGKTFFTNSGAEAVEAAIKLVRRWGFPHRYEVITMENSFHGRTLGAMAATGQPKHHLGFEPIPPGFRHVPFNQIRVLEKAIGPKTAAVMIELIQGEGGIHVATPTYVKQLRRLCDERNLLLLFDEISTGMGRTGTLFCFQRYQVIPDILLLAKPAAGGLPLGVLIARRAISDIWEKASHATTFGGNPLATAAGLATLRIIRKKSLLQHVKRQGEYLRENLERLKKRHPIIREVRGMGLMIGIELNQPGKPVVQAALKHGLLINCTQEKILRMYPALTVTRKEIDQAITLFQIALEEVEAQDYEER